MKLGMSLKTGGKHAWNDNFELVYGIADMVMDRIVNEVQILGSYLFLPFGTGALDFACCSSSGTKD